MTEVSRATQTGTRMRRPGVVTLVVVLTYVAGLFDVLLGILAIFARYLPDVIDDGEGIRLVVTLVGAATLLFGLLTIALASGIARGDRVARWCVTGLLLLSFVLTAVYFIAHTGQGPVGMIVQAVISAVVILPLWIGRGGRYFAASTVPV
ncbi:hypothetical protein B7R22_15315 [Subtercola boreus]|uniref:DUF7144 domain-containing protein n=1 Tax=Subtercola boreus TaxID=120213 RepID=A0A3E0VSU6_9MICO|nr:hypothetical protein [Subtercola boreus]RFA12488.1 hypothetical protein B7R22_15315 [Subtercola boreus]